jgi:hypothetical protein
VTRRSDARKQIAGRAECSLYITRNRPKRAGTGSQSAEGAEIDIYDIIEHALGVMQMPLDEFELITVLHYDLKCRGFQKAQIQAWEHTRFIATAMLNTVSKKPMKPEQVMPLPSDKKQSKATKHTDKQALIERIKQRDKLK